MKEDKQIERIANWARIKSKYDKKYLPLADKTYWNVFGDDEHPLICFISEMMDDLHIQD